MSSLRLAFPLFLPLVLGLALLTGACGAPLRRDRRELWRRRQRAGRQRQEHDRPLRLDGVQEGLRPVARLHAARTVCQEREGDKDPYNVDYTQPQRMPCRGRRVLRAAAAAQRPTRRPRAGTPRPTRAAPTPAAPAAPAEPAAGRRRRRRRRRPAKPSAGTAGEAKKAKATRTAAPQAGQEGFTRSGGVCPLSRKASRLSSALKPMALRVSTVAEPMCGSRNAFSSP